MDTISYNQWVSPWVSFFIKKMWLLLRLHDCMCIMGEAHIVSLGWRSPVQGKRCLTPRKSIHCTPCLITTIFLIYNPPTQPSSLYGNNHSIHHFSSCFIQNVLAKLSLMHFFYLGYAEWPTNSLFLLSNRSLTISLLAKYYTKLSCIVFCHFLS